MGKTVAALLKGLAKALGKALSKMLLKVSLLFKTMLAKLLFLFKAMPTKVLFLFTELETSIKEISPQSVLDAVESIAQTLFLWFIRDEQAQEAAREMSRSLGQALLMDYTRIFAFLLFCFITLAVFIGFPLSYKALSRRRLRIFISFNRTREAIAENLEQCLDSEGMRVYRIPYQEGATHQNIVMQATVGIKKCHGFVCLPGQAQSYVEHEVLAATAAEKPITFLISESSGTLPNTADKRYPVFRLEATIRGQFKPLITFLNYVGADLRSTWKLCQRALSHPFMSVPTNAVIVYSGVVLFGLWAYCYNNVTKHVAKLTNSSPAFAEVKTPVAVAHLFILGLLVLIAFVIFSYVFLFVINLLRQFHARRRARLKAVATQFNRDDWIGVVPDLSPGGGIYECLFDAAPAAHHEIEHFARSVAASGHDF